MNSYVCLGGGSGANPLSKLVTIRLTAEALSALGHREQYIRVTYDIKIAFFSMLRGFDFKDSNWEVFLLFCENVVTGFTPEFL